jgi:hypothetical protein
MWKKGQCLGKSKKNNLRLPASHRIKVSFPLARTFFLFAAAAILVFDFSMMIMMKRGQSPHAPPRHTLGYMLQASERANFYSASMRAV